MNIWDKHVVVEVRSVVNDKPGPVVATSKLHHGHFMADMGGAPAGKYVVDVKPGSTGYGAGQTLIDYPGPGGNVHQSFTLVLGRSGDTGQELNCAPSSPLQQLAGTR